MGIDVAAHRRSKKIEAKKARQARAVKESVAAFKQGYRGTSHVCTQCGELARPVRIVKGNLLVEILLWLFFMLPGLAYSIWRHASAIKGCPGCKTQTMVKADSKKGRALTGR